MSTFCTTTISEVLRMESHRLDRVKSGFLSSVSHEMRFPLHNTLGNLELLLQTDCSEEQHRLAMNARFGTIQLLETFDKILQYTNSDCAPEATQRATLEQHGNKTQDSTLRVGPQSEHTASVSSTVDLISLCVDVVEDITVMRPQAEGRRATTFVATSCQDSRAMCHVTCRVLCCSVALLLCMLCGHRAGCINPRVSLIYRIVGVSSFIRASCST
jgi:signal transduction histidine kinase